MTVRLRAHHLLCMLTYAGKGYTPPFTANYDLIAGRLSRGEEIVIVEGPDDVCAPLLSGTAPHCLDCSVAERDRLAADDVGALLGRPIRAGERIEPDALLLTRLREGFQAGSIRSACTGCEWAGLCDEIAAGGYERARISGPPC